MNEFDYNGPVALQAVIVNPDDRTNVTIISGEFEELNGRILKPKQRMNLNLLIPPGYREYINEVNILNKRVMYIGLVNERAVEPLIHKPNL
jgi:hypothetical protein